MTRAARWPPDADRREQPQTSRLVALARVPRGVPRVDIAIAAVLLAWALLEALFADGPGTRPVRVLLAIAFVAPLVVRRRWPAPVLLAIVVAAVTRGTLGGPEEVGAMPFPALLLASFSVALYGRPRRLAYVALPVPIVTMFFAGYDGDISIGSGGMIAAGAWIAGWTLRRRAEALARTRAEAPELAREAVLAERAAMARELHDIVAHSVTVISVQAGAAEELLESRPGAAREHLAAVRRSAHEALVELRRLVGVLREDDDPAHAPQPGLDRLDELLADARAAGLPVELAWEGARGPLAPGADLAAYRVVQESLTNARRHAGAVATRVRVSRGEDALEIEVVNAPGARDAAAGEGGGRGLAGMGERVRLSGGSLRSGPTDDGGFAVRAELPLGEPAPVPPVAPAEREDAPAPRPGDWLLAVARVPRHIPRVDVLLAGALGAWALLEALLIGWPAPWWARILLALGLSLPLLVRRRHPIAAMAAVCALIVVLLLFSLAAAGGAMPFVILYLAAFSAGLHTGSPARALVAAALALAPVAVLATRPDEPSAAAVDFAVGGFLVVGALVAGIVVRRRAAQVAAARAEAPELARAAVVAERARMARELHDVVAHAVTIISVQAGAAEQLLESRPGEARGHLAAVRAGAREALVELRRLVGVLREDDDAAYAPQPGLERLGDLVVQTRAAGVPVSLRREGPRGALAAGLELAAYRIVQESLTNVCRHAAGAETTVLVRRDGDWLELEVANATGGCDGASQAGGGRGLIGMRERARLYGGTLDAGRAADGGFVVRARLPLEEAST